MASAGGRQLRDLVDLGDSRVAQGRERFRLPLEANEAVRISGEELGEDLDGDVAIEPGVARAIDLAHAAGAERSNDGVRPEAGPCREGHAAGVRGL